MDIINIDDETFNLGIEIISMILFTTDIELFKKVFRLPSNFSYSRNIYIKVVYINIFGILHTFNIHKKINNTNYKYSDIMNNTMNKASYAMIKIEFSDDNGFVVDRTFTSKIFKIFRYTLLLLMLACILYLMSILITAGERHIEMISFFN